MNEIFDGTKLSLSEWLNIIFSNKASRLLPNNCFPTDEIRNEYLDLIHDRSEDEIKNLLRRFLIRSRYLGKDNFFVEYIKRNWDLETLIRKIKNIEYCRRLFTKNGPAWGGLTWILDLLPDSPKDAINVINSYWVAHCQILPDYSLYGLSESTMIIRSRYCDCKHPRDILLNLKAKEFEWLVEELYKRMNYHTKLTKDSYDGGIDIIAEKFETGLKEKILVQCKKYKSIIGVKEIRTLLGVVSDNKATKGVLLCSSNFSTQAKKMAKNNSRIELINYTSFMTLLNQYLGSKWHLTMDNIFLRKNGIALPIKLDL